MTSQNTLAVRLRFYTQLCADGDAALDGTGNRAKVGVHVVHPLCRFDIVPLGLKDIFHMNALYQQHSSVFTNLTGRF